MPADYQLETCGSIVLPIVLWIHYFQIIIDFTSLDVVSYLQININGYLLAVNTNCLLFHKGIVYCFTKELITHGYINT